MLFNSRLCISSSLIINVVLRLLIVLALRASLLLAAFWKRSSLRLVWRAQIGCHQVKQLFSCISWWLSVLSVSYPGFLGVLCLWTVAVLGGGISGLAAAVSEVWRCNFLWLMAVFPGTESVAMACISDILVPCAEQLEVSRSLSGTVMGLINESHIWHLILGFALQGEPHHDSVPSNHGNILRSF